MADAKEKIGPTRFHDRSAGERGETDAAALARRVRRALHGFLDIRPVRP
jgi:hypothetical protein